MAFSLTLYLGRDKHNPYHKPIKNIELYHSSWFTGDI